MSFTVGKLGLEHRAVAMSEQLSEKSFASLHALRSYFRLRMMKRLTQHMRVVSVVAAAHEADGSPRDATCSGALHRDGGLGSLQ